MSGTLTVRKGRCGITVEGEAPEQHSFPTQFLARELNKAVRVHVVIPSDPEVRYEVTGITPTEWTADRIHTPESKPARRRWWQRRKKK
jgi:hypothetical protein